MSKIVGLFLAILTMSCAACAESQAPPEGESTLAQGRRLMPPQSLRCARNDLTSFTGIVIAYERSREEITLRIRTDADTVEDVRLRHRDPENPEADFLVNRAPFTESDWARIESAPGELKPDTRVTAWVCLDGETEPVFDWDPRRTP